MKFLKFCKKLSSLDWGKLYHRFLKALTAWDSKKWTPRACERPLVMPNLRKRSVETSKFHFQIESLRPFQWWLGGLGGVLRIPKQHSYDSHVPHHPNHQLTTGWHKGLDSWLKLFFFVQKWHLNPTQVRRSYAVRTLMRATRAPATPLPTKMVSFQLHNCLPTRSQHLGKLHLHVFTTCSYYMLLLVKSQWWCDWCKLHRITESLNEPNHLALRCGTQLFDYLNLSLGLESGGPGHLTHTHDVNDVTSFPSWYEFLTPKIDRWFLGCSRAPGGSVFTGLGLGLDLVEACCHERAKTLWLFDLFWLSSWLVYARDSKNWWYHLWFLTHPNHFRRASKFPKYFKIC